jgi:hypothetical protein
MADCKYIRDQYDVPADVGRRVVVYGKPGIIAEDRGHYLGVNFDCDRPGVIHNCHPTSEVVYGDMGHIRQPTPRCADKEGGMTHTSQFSEILRTGWTRDDDGYWVHHTAAKLAGLPDALILTRRYPWERRGTKAKAVLASFVGGRFPGLEAGGNTKAEAAATLIVMAMASKVREAAEDV